MELIKKIKEAEAQAQQIIEQAKAQSAGQAEQGRESRLQVLTEAEQERKKALEAAVAVAHSQAVAEIKDLKAQAEKKRQQLRERVANKIAGAVVKVMDYLGSHFAKRLQNGDPLRG